MVVLCVEVPSSGVGATDLVTDNGALVFSATPAIEDGASDPGAGSGGFECSAMGIHPSCSAMYLRAPATYTTHTGSICKPNVTHHDDGCHADVVVGQGSVILQPLAANG